MPKKLKAVLDTNILISGIIYKGKPRLILEKVFGEKIKAIISPILIAELIEVLTKKFLLPPEKIALTEQEIEDIFDIVNPSITLNILKDEDDNRVVEAAIEGKSDFIVTGDKQLLNLKSYRGIKIVTAGQFLELID